MPSSAPGADYHVIVNPDIWFGEGVIEILAAYMDRHPDAGLIAPKTVYPDGETQYLCKLLPTPFDLILREILPAGFFKASRERFELRFTGYDREMNVPFLSGCFMFLRIGTLKGTGLFDERYFMYARISIFRVVSTALPVPCTVPMQSSYMPTRPLRVKTGKCC